MSIKKLNIINLNNKINFLFLTFVVVFILTFLNTYFFYEYVKIRDYQEIRLISNTIHYQVKSCKTQKKCITKINKFLNKTRPFIELSLVDINDKKLINYSNIKKRHRDRVPVEITRTIVEDKNNYKLYVLKKSTPNIFFAATRSITFSIKDIFEKITDKGMIHASIWYFKEKIYLRSQDVIFFILFAYILLKMLSIKQLQLSRQINKQNLDIVKLVQDIKSAKKYESELEIMINDLKTQNIDTLSKMKKYDSIINPPLDLLKYEDIVNLDPESIIFKCRKVTEKIITTLYIQHIGSSEFKNLNNMISELKNKNIINKKAFSYANTIKAFGNISAHPDFENPFEFTKEDAKVISNALILLVEELNIK